MPHDPNVELAKELHLLGISHAGIVEVMSGYPHDRIRQQLEYLPYRKAKRPEAFLIEAVRNNYSPPKEYFYAKAEAQRADSQPLLDQGAELGLRQADADSQGHGTSNSPYSDPVNLGLEPEWESRDLALPPTAEENRARV